MERNGGNPLMDTKKNPSDSISVILSLFYEPGLASLNYRVHEGRGCYFFLPPFNLHVTRWCLHLIPWRLFLPGNEFMVPLKKILFLKSRSVRHLLIRYNSLVLWFSPWSSNLWGCFWGFSIFLLGWFVELIFPLFSLELIKFLPLNRVMKVLMSPVSCVSNWGGCPRNSLSIPFPNRSEPMNPFSSSSNPPKDV